MVTVSKTSAREETFELPTVGCEADAVCACPSCDAGEDEFEFKLLLGADMRGMLADYGTVGFCSYECVEEFVALEQVYDAHPEAWGTVIFWSEPVVARVEIDGATVARAIGFDQSAAHEAVQDEISELLELGYELDELTMTYDYI